MAGIVRIEGRAIPFGRANVDTDLIIPAAHLKTVSRLGLGRYAFEPLRREPGNVFDEPEFSGAPILIAGANFGCGSSREHAVWALCDLGIKAVIAPSFSDIFAANAFRNGLVTVVLPPEAIDRLLAVAGQGRFLVDLETMEVSSAHGDRFAFELDPSRRDTLMTAGDEIGLTLTHDVEIAAYEAGSAFRTWAMPPPSA